MNRDTARTSRRAARMAFARSLSALVACGALVACNAILDAGAYQVGNDTDGGDEQGTGGTSGDSDAGTGGVSAGGNGAGGRSSSGGSSTMSGGATGNGGRAAGGSAGRGTGGRATGGATGSGGATGTGGATGSGGATGTGGTGALGPSDFVGEWDCPVETVVTNCGDGMPTTDTTTDSLDWELGSGNTIDALFLGTCRLVATVSGRAATISPPMSCEDNGIAYLISGIFTIKSDGTASLDEKVVVTTNGASCNLSGEGTFTKYVPPP